MLLLLEADPMREVNLLKGESHAVSHMVGTTKTLSAIIVIRRGI